MGQIEMPRSPRLRTLPLPPRAQAEQIIGSDWEVLADEHLAFALVLALRDLRTWTEASEEEWAQLFGSAGRVRTAAMAHACETVPEISAALETVLRIRDQEHPVEAASLAGACRRLARWADRRGLVQIAVRFAEAGASVEPSNPALANDAARLARQAGLPLRSDIWYDRGVGLAGRQRNRREVIRGLLGRANLLREQRRYAETRSLLARAAQLASSTRRHRQAAETQHDLFALAVMDGTFAEAEHHMLAALEHYPIHHPAIGRLVHDWAFLLVQHALYADAIPLLQASIPQIRRAEIQLLSWGTLSSAAAGAGRRDLYDEAVVHVVSLAEHVEEYAAAAMAHAAYGARFFGEWESGRSLATRASEIARARGEDEAEHWIHEILAGIEAHEAPPPQAEPPEGSRITMVAERMMGVLEARRRPTRRPVQVDPEKEASGPSVPARPAESGS